MYYIVAIIGRPNVGKSTLFNRLIESSKAIVDDFSGVTRDRQYGDVEWNGKKFQVIDTGGFVPDSKDFFEKEILRQIKLAIDEANAFVFMVDVKLGILPIDFEIKEMLRKSNKPVYLVVNKVDNPQDYLAANEFYNLGYDHFYQVCSNSGSGTGDLLDALCEKIILNPLVEKPTIPKLAIVGQPNVGKSSLLNTFLDEDRVIVSEIAGTTRDSIYTHFNKFGKELIIIDTAGIRKKTATINELEFYSIIRAIKALEEADVCLLMIDAKEGITAQDINLFSLAARKGKGILIAVNKWDLIEKNTKTTDEFTKRILEKIAPFTDVPIIFISVKEKQRLIKILDLIIDIARKRSSKISTSKLNDVMLKAIQEYQAPVVRGHVVKIKYITQVTSYVPSFVFFTNFPNDIKTPYRNYLENQLRKHFDFKGVPIRIIFRQK
ncbi:MAG: ribosome biogenesis GTPase Der [Sediminibacterium sp.]|nr:ribosome biogenesis GTPase Der [Sediminibacterium sp.]